MSLVKLVNEFVRFRLDRISSVGDRLVRLSDLFNEMMAISVCKDGQTEDGKMQDDETYSSDEPTEVIGKTPQVGQEHVCEVGRNEVI